MSPPTATPTFPPRPSPSLTLPPPRRKYFNESVQGVTDALVSATVELYNNIRAELLPTPSKSHYTFNLRDLSKVVQGVMRADTRNTTAPNQVLSLWLHECCRVFQDRLINDDDHGWFRAQQQALLAKGWGTKYEQVVTTERLIYGDFMVPGEPVGKGGGGAQAARAGSDTVAARQE